MLTTIQAALTAISQVRFENGKTPSIVRKFLIDQLRYNDNTNNQVSKNLPLSFAVADSLSQYSDARYIGSVILALGNASISTAPPEHGELLQMQARTDLSDEDINLLEQATTEIERYRTMDRLVPSSHNVVTIAALEVHRHVIS